MSETFDKVFIPNRGVIAVRAIRTLRDLGIGSVVGYSEADRASLAVRLADEACLLGPAPARTSYMDIRRIIRAAREARCDALFPGYGFLSESAELADRCADAGITFIGPPAPVLRRLGHKGAARRALVEAGFPVLPGKDYVDGPEDVRAFGEEVGYPLLLKPAAGAGGLGTTRVDRPSDVPAQLEHSRAVATIATGEDAVIVEKWIEGAAAISFPFIVDQQGTAIHFGDREGSIQRGYGKLIDEAPSPKLDTVTRATMGALIARVMSDLGYVGAGTVEFLRDSSGEMYALEVNPRIQVEHVVTEVVVQVDLIEQMIRVAAGLPLSLCQEDITFTRHAIQCRVKAEDPRRGFCPCHGKVTRLNVSDGPSVRRDDGIYEGCDIPMYYDSLLLQICTADEDRTAAIAKLSANLADFRVHGVKTTVPLVRQILEHPAFLDGSYDTSFLERHLTELLTAAEKRDAEEVVRLSTLVAESTAHEQNPYAH